MSIQITYTITEDSWNDTFEWFLVDEGEIQYSFTSKEVALAFQREHFLGFMLLTSSKTIAHDTMLDPLEFRSWTNKIQRCVVRNWFGPVVLQITILVQLIQKKPVIYCHSSLILCTFDAYSVRIYVNQRQVMDCMWWMRWLPGPEMGGNFICFECMFYGSASNRTLWTADK